MKKEDQATQLLEIFALIIAIAAVIIFVFHLFYAYNKCIIFTEPISVIKISEIVIGIICLLVLFNMLRKNLLNFIVNKW